MMRRVSRLSVLAFVLLATVGCATAQQGASSYKPRMRGGWEILFDGKNLDAWDVAPGTNGWAIDDQKNLTVTGPGRNLYTKRRYCDFVLDLDYRIVGHRKCNSGVFIRVHDKNDEVNTGMEIQILDDDDYGVKWDAMNANGALYDLVHPSVDANKPVGEWEHFRITVKGSQVTVVSNGKEIVKADLSKWTEPGKNPDGQHNKFPHAIGSLPREGFIGLQNYGGVPVWFRDIRIKPLSTRQPKFTGAEPIEDVLGK
jgi:hypothetical protein